MINTGEPVHSFTIRDADKDPSLIWTILTHPGTYIGTYIASPNCQLYFPVSLWHAIVDDDVEVAPIYRSWGTVEEPRRPHKNHDLHIEQEATRP